MAEEPGNGIGSERAKFTLLPDNSGNEIDGSGSASFGAIAPDFGRGSGDVGDDFDPSIHVSRDKRNADGSYTRKRGRRSGSGNSNSGSSPKKTNQASLEALQRMLAIVHVGLAAATKSPELELDTEDARALTLATSNVLEQFDIKPDPKVEAVVGLVITAGSIYGPKLYLIRERRMDEAKERDKQRQAMGGIQIVR